MKTEFISYEQALILKELGFDEPCLAFWDGKNTDAFYFNNIRDASGDYVPFQKHDRLKWFGAPLYQQAFRWLRAKYNLIGLIEGGYNNGNNLFTYVIWQGSFDNYIDTYWKSYEEAEQACLGKLIEIVKNK